MRLSVVETVGSQRFDRLFLDTSKQALRLGARDLPIVIVLNVEVSANRRLQGLIDALDAYLDRRPRIRR